MNIFAFDENDDHQFFFMVSFLDARANYDVPGNGTGSKIHSFIVANKRWN